MTYLLDVSTIIALLWQTHSDHVKVSAWAKGKKLAVCPITELGFIRVSTSKAFNLSMADTRKLLENFIESTEFVPDDLRALEGAVAPNSAKTTDWYLANLAQKHGMRWATLDRSAKHPVAELIS
jgi:predicted nucleic acid-binding protein